MSSQTYISQGVQLTGDIIATETVVIDGKMSGNIRSTEHVSLGTTAHFEGSIESKSALIAGHVKGSIHAESSLVVKVPATIIGDLISASVQVESGVVLQGKILSNPHNEPELRITQTSQPHVPSAKQMEITELEQEQ